MTHKIQENGLLPGLPAQDKGTGHEEWPAACGVERGGARVWSSQALHLLVATLYLSG